MLSTALTNILHGQTLVDDASLKVHSEYTKPHST
jgi:hypothetical protein